MIVAVHNCVKTRLVGSLQFFGWVPAIERTSSFIPPGADFTASRNTAELNEPLRKLPEIPMIVFIRLSERFENANF